MARCEVVLKVVVMVTIVFGGVGLVSQLARRSTAKELSREHRLAVSEARLLQLQSR